MSDTRSALVLSSTSVVSVIKRSPEVLIATAWAPHREGTNYATCVAVTYTAAHFFSAEVTKSAGTATALVIAC